MKKYLIVIVLPFMSALAQDRIYVSYNPGVSLYNSENHMKDIGDKEARWSGGLGIGCMKDSVLGAIGINVEYSYMYSRVPDVQQFAYTAIDPTQATPFAADLILDWHSIDVDLNWSILDVLSLSVGPSVSYVGRSIIIDNIPATPPSSFEDRLQSICIGLNGSLNGEIPLGDGDEYPFFLAHLRMRFLHSLWFDARGRNLHDYYQTFLLQQLNIGVGYRF